jgi:hypothetical protein
MGLAIYEAIDEELIIGAHNQSFDQGTIHY